MHAGAPLLQRVQHAYVAHEAVAYRACALCDHGRGAQCTRPGAVPEPAHVARSSAGACGPEAVHLRIRGWDLRS